MGSSKHYVVFLEIAMHKLTIGLRDFSVFLRNVGSHVAQIRKDRRKHSLEANAGFIKTLDWKQKRTPSRQPVFNDRHIIIAATAIKKIDLTIGLWMDVLIDQLRVSKLAEAHPLSNTVHLLEVPMKEVSRNEPLDRVTDVANRVNRGFLVMPRQIQRKFVVAHAAYPRMTANDLAHVLASVLLGLKQRV